MLADPELEKKFVATKIVYPEAAKVNIDPEYIWNEMLRTVYTAVLRCEADTGEWSAVSIVNLLQYQGALKGGLTPEYVYLLEDVSLVIFDYREAAFRLKSLALARRQRDLIDSANRDLESGEYESATKKIAAASNVRPCCDDGIQILSAIDLAKFSRDMVADNGCSRRAQVPTGISIVDAVIGGLTPGSMTTIGGYTGSGKSSLALIMAMNQARSGKRVGIISCEDPPEVSAARILSHLSDVPASHLFRCIFSADRLPSILQQVNPAVERAANLPLYMAHCIGGARSSVIDAAQKLIKTVKCDILYLDYIQAVRVDLQLNRYDKAVADIAKQLKGLCFSNQIPLVVLSQLSRPRDKAYNEPYLTDLKESGDLENESEIVMLLWQGSDKPGAETFFKIAKCKWAMAGTRGILKRSSVTGMVVGISEKAEAVQPQPQHKHWQD